MLFSILNFIEIDNKIIFRRHLVVAQQKRFLKIALAPCLFIDWNLASVILFYFIFYYSRFQRRKVAD